MADRYVDKPAGNVDEQARQRGEEQLAKLIPFSKYEYVTVVFDTADIDVAIPHGLSAENPEWVRYEVVRISSAGVVYQDLSATRKPWQNTHIYLRSSAVAVARIRLSIEPYASLIDTPLSRIAVGLRPPVITPSTTTRIYLSTTAAGYTPSNYRGSWQDTGDAVTKALLTSKTVTPDTSNTFVTANHDTPAAPTRDILCFRGVSAPLASATTISGTVTGVIQANGGIFADHAMRHHVHVYVTAGDTDTVRGTLLTDYIDSTTWSGLQGQEIPAQTMSSVSASAGDRIVVELGARTTQTAVPTFEYWARIGYKDMINVSDATHHDGNSESVSWLEFSQVLTFS